MRWILVSAMLALSGCHTFRTTAVDRCEHDILVVNPTCPMKGIPVSLRVPTHLELSVIETTFWEKQDRAGTRPSLVPLSTCRPTRRVEPQIRYTEKIFLVDPVRPAAGTQNYGFSFTSGKEGNTKDAGKGYLAGVDYKIDDQTIKESANLLANSLNFISALSTSSAQPTANEANLIATDRTVAYGHFDINSPAFEEEMMAFLECHVNSVAGRSCGPCAKVCTPNMCQGTQQ